jgi:hypothetical protein
MTHPDTPEQLREGRGAGERRAGGAAMASATIGTIRASRRKRGPGSGSRKGPGRQDGVWVRAARRRRAPGFASVGLRTDFAIAGSSQAPPPPARSFGPRAPRMCFINLHFPQQGRSPVGAPKPAPPAAASMGGVLPGS